jgi:hypothetical protein
MFKVSLASLQIFIGTPNCVLEDRVQYTTVHIPNVFCDGNLQIINCMGIVRIHCVFHQVHRDFLITLYKYEKGNVHLVRRPVSGMSREVNTCIISQMQEKWFLFNHKIIVNTVLLNCTTALN